MQVCPCATAALSMAWAAEYSFVLELALYWAWHILAQKGDITDACNVLEYGGSCIPWQLIICSGFRSCNHSFVLEENFD